MAIETPQGPAAALRRPGPAGAGPAAAGEAAHRRQVWAAAWPKLLALVLALAVWQIVYLSGFKSAILPGPATTLTDLWHQLHGALLWTAIGTTLRRAVIGFAIALVIGTVVGALVSRSGRCGPRSALSSRRCRRCPRSCGSRSPSSCSARTRPPSCS